MKITVDCGEYGEYVHSIDDAKCEFEGLNDTFGIPDGASWRKIVIEKESADDSKEANRESEVRRMETVGARGTDSAKIISVIETKALRGKGTEKDPERIVTQYWGFDGKLLAEYDSVKEDKEAFNNGKENRSFDF